MLRELPAYAPERAHNRFVVHRDRQVIAVVRVDPGNRAHNPGHRLREACNDAERVAAVAELDRLHAALDDALAEAYEARDCSDRLSDRIVSTGEKSMSVLMAATLRSRGTGAAHVFADQVIATDGRHGSARPDRDRTREAAERVVRPLLDAVFATKIGEEIKPQNCAKVERGLEVLAPINPRDAGALVAFVAAVANVKSAAICKLEV